MQLIFLDDPAWKTTFPHPVAPHPDEWLAGLLLRCDEANGWKSRTSLFFWSRVFHPQPASFWAGKRNLIVPPWPLTFDPLVQLLSLPEAVLLATTYGGEMARLLSGEFGVSGLVTPVFSFRVCPECLAQDRLLRRVLILPQIRCCPKHHLVLQRNCLCGEPLQIFSSGTSPFACSRCRLDWANLSHVPASEERLVLERKYLSLYELFFSEDAKILHERARYLVNERLVKRYPDHFASRSFQGYYYGHVEGPPEMISIAPLVSVLVEFGYSSQDILQYDSSHQRGDPSKKWRKLYDSAVMEMFHQNLLLEESDG